MSKSIYFDEQMELPHKYLNYKKFSFGKYGQGSRDIFYANCPVNAEGTN